MICVPVEEEELGAEKRLLQVRRYGPPSLDGVDNWLSEQELEAFLVFPT